MRYRRSFYTYVLALSAAAGVLCVFLPWDKLWALQSSEIVGVGTFVALALLSQAMAVDSVIGTARPVKISVSYLPLLGMAVVFPPPAVVLAAGGMTAANEVLRRDRVWYRSFFNVSQALISYGLGALVFQGLLELATEGVLFESTAALSRIFFPFYGLVLAVFGLNLIFISLYVSLREEQSFWSVVQEAAGRGGGNLVYDLLASPVALLAAYLYVKSEVVGLVAVVLPLLLIRYTYLSTIQLQKANGDLLNVLIKAIETRDPYTSGHSRRVSLLARMIAEDYGLRARAIGRVETAALLHDIGKIDALYAQIISKEGSLTEAERDVIRTHATKGADLLATLTSLDKEIIVGVRHHHERYDGGGYPDGLAKKEIPLPARIIMICDSIDAMLSDRPYRNALPVSEVRKELKRCAATQFDPDLVDTILERNTLERAELLVDRSGARAPVRVAVG